MASASTSNRPECSICCEDFKIPKFLPCGHTFCLDCIQRYIDDKIEIFPCPLCGQDVTIPVGGAKMFTTNYIAQTTTLDTTEQPSLTTLDTTEQPSLKTLDTTEQPSLTTPDTIQQPSLTEQPSLTTLDTTEQPSLTTPDTTEQPSLTTSDTTELTSLTTPDTTQLPSLTTPDTTQLPSSTSDTTQQVGTALDKTESAKESSSVVKQYCSNHSLREVEYYCIDCNTLVCSKCFINQHNGHDFIDVENETAKEKATELVLTSEEFIKNKIENLEKTHAALLETSENLKCFVEDACRRISKQTEKIIEEIKEKSEQVQIEIRDHVDQTEVQLTETREEVMEQIKTFNLNLKTNLPSLSEDSCVQILASLPKIKQLEQQCDTMKDYTSEVYQYKDWREKSFTVDIDMLGSVITKTSNLYKFNHFRFKVNDIEEEGTFYYSKDKYTSNDVVWSCVVCKYNTGYLGIGIKIFPSDNPKLKKCIIDFKVSLLNMNDGGTTKTRTRNVETLDFNRPFGWTDFILWDTFIDKNKGFISSDGQFVIKLDITQVKEISFE